MLHVDANTTVAPIGAPNRRAGRFAIAALCLLALLCAAWCAAYAGAGRALSAYGIAGALLVDESETSELLAPVDKAVEISSSDPEAHYARAVVLSSISRYDEAVKEYEKAVARRPRFYYSWMRLGRARSQAGDVEGALAAFRQAVQLAPYYVEPRWQLGNLLLRENRVDEAFTELRQATASDPSLYSYSVNLAWAAYGGDADAVREAIQPRTPTAQLELARLFLKRGKTDEGMRLFRTISDQISDESRRALIVELITARRFVQAREVWESRQNKKQTEEKGNALNQITDGSFEVGIKTDEPGFGWQPSRGAQGVRFALDAGEPRTGKRSLRIEWSGNTTPLIPVLSQIVLVEPATHYRLNFAVRAGQVVTGGVPVVSVVDTSSDQILAPAKVLPQGTTLWQDDSIEFSTSKNTDAVIINIVRENCTSNPCPIFGHTWLDDFSLQKLSSSSR